MRHTPSSPSGIHMTSERRKRSTDRSSVPRKATHRDGPVSYTHLVQDNQSSSVKGVLRGLHFQIEHPQSKLVRVVSGEVFDVAVDLRPDSPTYGKWEGAVLSAENRRQFFVPRGFAHGFLVLSDIAEFCYKCDDVYHPNDEGGLMWNDPEIGIEWPISEGMELVLSEKDKAHPGLKDLA